MLSLTHLTLCVLLLSCYQFEARIRHRQTWKSGYRRIFLITNYELRIAKAKAPLTRSVSEGNITNYELVFAHLFNAFDKAHA